MKTKLSLRFLHKPIITGLRPVVTRLLFIIALSPALCALSQIPQGFNYQAVARNASGGLITNTPLPVRITIQSDSLGGTIFWQELHSSVTTSSLGVINLVLGKGTRQIVSTVASFSAIDWSVTPKFLKTEIYYSGWKTMGVSRLWSVPYAVMAGDLAGSVKKLAVKGETSGLEDALFEVKNKDGQTVFAVYNEGVRVYVSNGDKGLKGGFAVGGFGTDKAGESTKYLFVGKDSVRVYLDTNPLTKKLKGGFAVGGYDLTKGIVQDYLDVNSDSVRIYIDSDPSTKKLKGGFAVGGYDMTKGANTNYMNVNTDASGIINPSQNRILWYPLKNAFLTGKVLISNKDSVGENSFSSGFESKAIGNWSQAMGYQAISRGVSSSSIGYQSVADDSSSFAFGQWAKALNKESYAFGRGSVASGYRSFSFGSAGIDTDGKIVDVPYALGDYSFALGAGAKAAGEGSMSIGNSKANGLVSLAMGDGATADGDCSTAIGMDTKSSGVYSTAIGMFAEASNWHTMALGWHSTASGDCSLAFGSNVIASGDYSAGFGWYAKAEGLYSTALGGSTATGDFSTAIGDGCKAIGGFSTVFGSECSSTGQFAQAFGYYTLASGSKSTAMGEQTVASGANSTAMGYYTLAPSGFETVIGRYNTIYTPLSTTDWNSADRLFVIGNGTYGSLSNAMTILKNGCVGLQSVTSPTYALQLPNSTATAMGSGRAYAWTTYSDSRLKENQIPLGYGLQEIIRLSPKQYIHHNSIDQATWSADNAPKSIGFVAQDVYDVIPEAVNVPENNASELWGLDYDKFIPVLVKAIQEQQQQIESQKRENNNLKSQLQTLQKKVDKIEVLLAKSLNE